MDIVVKNVCGDAIPIRECLLYSGDVKKIPYSALSRNDVREAWARGFLEVIKWPDGKEPISFGTDSAPLFRLPDGDKKRDVVFAEMRKA